MMGHNHQWGSRAMIAMPSGLLALWETCSGCRHSRLVTDSTYYEFSPAGCRSERDATDLELADREEASEDVRRDIIPVIDSLDWEIPGDTP